MTAQPTVLVVDDSPTLRRIITSVLEREGCLVAQAADGVEAIDRALALQPDVVVADAELPRVSGYVVSRVLAEMPETAGLPVVLLGDAARARDRFWSGRSRAAAFLGKDFEVPELLATVRGLVETSRSRAPRTPVDAPGEAAVLERVAAFLDRSLFEVSAGNEMIKAAVLADGFEDTVGRLLAVFGGLVDVDLAAILVLEDRTTYVSVLADCAHQQYTEFFGALAEAAGNVAGEHVAVSELVPRVADPHGRLGAEDEGGVATFLSLPLRAGDEVVGCLALSRAVRDGLDEQSVRTLGLVVSVAAAVLARSRRAGAAGGR